MTDLRCDEVLDPLEDPSYSDDAHFCNAVKDRAILNDNRVFKNMLALEEFYLPDASFYTEVQDEIKLHMRKIVAEWMLDVCLHQRCHTDVFLLATNIMDRFLATIRLQKKQFQLLGAACIFLASKMIEPQPIPALTLVSCTANTYDSEELLSMELLILSKLKWDLTAVTSYDYLDYMIHNVQNSSAVTLDVQVKRNSEKLVTLCAKEEAFLTTPPSLVAASALITSIEQDNSINQLHVNLNHILDSVLEASNSTMAMLGNCKSQIEKIFFQCNETVNMNLTEHEDQESPSTHQNLHNHHRNRNFHTTQADSHHGHHHSQSGSDQSTPTEVFSVSALYVT